MNAVQALKTTDRLTGASRNLSRISSVMGATKFEVLGAGETPAKSPQAAVLASASHDRDLRDGAGTLVGGVAGLYLGSRRKHPYLGVIVGGSLGRNVPALWRGGDERTIALRNLTTTGGGVGGALLFRKHPVLGYIGGLVAGGIVSHYIMGWK